MPHAIPQPSTPLTGTTGLILASAFEVANVLGAGFLEKVYERALAHELELRGAGVSRQSRFRVPYKACIAGDFCPDLIVNQDVLVEVKCVASLAPEHVAQCLNYLKVTGLEVCLLINFQRPRLEYKRLVRSREWTKPQMDADQRR